MKKLIALSLLSLSVLTSVANANDVFSVDMYLENNKTTKLANTEIISYIKSVDQYTGKTEKDIVEVGYSIEHKNGLFAINYVGFLGFQNIDIPLKNIDGSLSGEIVSLQLPKTNIRAVSFSLGNLSEDIYKISLIKGKNSEILKISVKDKNGKEFYPELI